MVLDEVELQLFLERIFAVVKLDSNSAPSIAVIFGERAGECGG